MPHARSFQSTMFFRTPGFMVIGLSAMYSCIQKTISNLFKPTTSKVLLKPLKYRDAAISYWFGISSSIPPFHTCWLKSGWIPTSLTELAPCQTISRPLRSMELLVALWDLLLDGLSPLLPRFLLMGRSDSCMLDCERASVLVPSVRNLSIDVKCCYWCDTSL